MSKNAELLERRKNAVAGGVASATPIFAERAENAELWDVDGNRYIDFAMGMAVVNTGHCHPKVIEGARAQLDKFTHTAFQVSAYEVYIRLAERLNELAPIKDGRSVFFTTGAEALENSVKVARTVTGRHAVITFRGGYHGRSALTSSMNGKIAPYRAGAGLGVGHIFHAPFPMEFHGVSVEDALEGLDHVFKTDVEPRDVAAIVIEPVLGEGGFYATPPAFMQALRKICDNNGIIFVVDEVQTGFGRTGKMFGIEHSGVEPDILCVAKAMAGGFPISGICGKAELMNQVGPGGLGGTYGGNPVACAAAHGAIDAILEEGLVERANMVGDRIKARVNALREEIPSLPIGDVRGLGAMIAVEFVKEAGSNTPDPTLVPQIMARAREKGLIMLACGYYGNCLRFLAPLTIPEAHLEEGLDIFEAALREVTGND